LPLGAVPQHDRRPRLINDLSFSGVNKATIPRAPKHSMQFGRALERLLHNVRHANPKFGPVYLNKIDVADGFYCIWLDAIQALQLACLLPKRPDEPQLVAVPLALPMGWVESPPFFCAATETLVDLANGRLHLQNLPYHRLEQEVLRDNKQQQSHPGGSSATSMPDGDPSDCTKPEPVRAEAPGGSSATSMPDRNPSDRLLTGQTSRDRGNSADELPSAMPAPPPRPSRYQLQKAVKGFDVYVDDVIGMLQGEAAVKKQMTRVILHTFDEIFQPLRLEDQDTQQEPVSLKKLRKGDGVWETRKTILGWIVDTIQKTLELPAHRADRIATIFQELQGQNRVSTNHWHKVLGELRSMAAAVPGARGLFSALQTGLLQKEAKHRIRIDSSIRMQLNDFAWLARNLHERPTRLEEIVPDEPSGIGTVDASGLGMGGTWFVPGTRPLLWRARFPPSVARRLVTFQNPHGTINNSDLELAGMIAHQNVLAQAVVVQHCNACYV
jgi:hypothetical protein